MVAIAAYQACDKSMTIEPETRRCPVCDSSSITSFLRRDNVPVHQNFPLPDRNTAANTIRGSLNLAVCHSCGFIFNQTFNLDKLAYGENYDNTQTHSSAFEKHVSELIHHLVFQRNVQHCNVIEVGCGKGQFIKQLVEIEAWQNTGYGFDPSYVGPLESYNGRLKFEQRYYDEQCANIQADVVVCRHVIEHVPEPVQLLRTIRLALAQSPRARVFFETPCVEWILENQVIWDFFYEHCSYFTADSLTTAFEISGFKVVDVSSIFGGQYLWLEAIIENAVKNIHEMPKATLKPQSIPALAEKFAKSEHDLIHAWSAKIRQLKTTGLVALWGAGAKGVTFANLIDPNCEWIDCIIDINPNKQSKYIPGAGHPIVRYQEICDRHIATVILMNPNYFEEISTLLAQEHLDIELIIG